MSRGTDAHSHPHAPSHRSELRPWRRRDEPGEPPPSPPARPRRGLLGWRRPNRRVAVAPRSPLVFVCRSLGRWLAVLGRRLLILGKIVGALALFAGAILAGRWGVRHVADSPRFAVREVRVAPTAHADRADIVALAGVHSGDRLLALDTDDIAARVARHPWILSARVSRELPATLVIDVTERRAAAAAVMGALYLVDEHGRPFKRATLAEAQGLVVLTGISHTDYVGLPRTSEAAFRQALEVYAAYAHPDGLSAARARSAGVTRPALSEIHIDPRNGYALFFLEGGGEVRLGQGQLADKLARLDEILAQLGPGGASALRVVHLDGSAADRVPIRLGTCCAAAPRSIRGPRSTSSTDPPASAGPLAGG